MDIKLDKRKKHLTVDDSERLIFNEACHKNTCASNIMSRSIITYLFFIVLPLGALLYFFYKADTMLLWVILFGIASLTFLLGVCVSMASIKINYVVTSKRLYIIWGHYYSSWLFSDIKKIVKTKKYKIIKIRFKKKTKRVKLFLGLRGKAFYKILLECKNIKSADAPTDIAPEIEQNEDTHLTQNTKKKRKNDKKEKKTNDKKAKNKSEKVNSKSTKATNSNYQKVGISATPKDTSDDVIPATPKETKTDVISTTPKQAPIALSLHDEPKAVVKNTEPLAPASEFDLSEIDFDINEMD